MVKLMFSPIDAKDYPVVSVGPYGDYGENLTNERIRAAAQREYLLAVDKLQKELGVKYNASLVKDVTDPSDDLSKSGYDEEFCAKYPETAVIEAVDKEMEELHGKDYYDETDHLFYT